MQDINFAEKLKQLRAERKMSQRKLAKMIGITHLQILNYEKGRSFPRTDVLHKLSLVFDIPLSSLVGEATASNILGEDKTPKIDLLRRRMTEDLNRSQFQ